MEGHFTACELKEVGPTMTSENKQKTDNYTRRNELVYIGFISICAFLIALLFAPSGVRPLFYAAIAGTLMGLGAYLILAIGSIGALVGRNRKTAHDRTGEIALLSFILLTAFTILSSDYSLRDYATGFLVGLIGTVVTVVGIQVYVLSYEVGVVEASVTAAKNEIQHANTEIQKAVDTFRADQVGAMSSAIKALENALEVKGAFETDKLKDTAGTLHPGIEAMGLSYKAWAERLQTGDRYVQRVWRAAFPSFYREEAYDIRGREIITNGRNYCYLLLGTLCQLLEQNEEGTVVYYQVTPVHPKDWYNWPHGFGEHHFYFENEFIGVYHRSLRALVQWANTTEKHLEHGRYILCLSESQNGDDVEQFGWDPARQDEFEKPEDFWLLDVPVPLDEELWPEPHCEFCKALRNYYLGAHREAEQRGLLRGKEIQYAVPAWNCYGWEKTLGHPLYTQKKAVFDAIRSSGQVGKCTCHEALLETLRTNFTAILAANQKTISNIVQSLRDEKRLSGAWERVVECITSDCISKFFPRLLEAYHLAEVLLSSNQQDATLLRAFLPVVLRTWSATQCHGWANLYDVFKKSLHSATTKARLIKCSPDQLKTWPVPEPEFGIFGWRPPSGGDIQWKVVIATSLNYPFDVARIRIYENNPDSTHYNEYRNYEMLITKLIDGRSPSEQLGSNSSTT